MKIRFISILLIFILLTAYSPQFIGASPGLNSKTKYRKFYIFNPFPYVLEKIFILNLSFNRGSAYNNSIEILDENGNIVHYQILNITYYPGTSYIANCSLAFFAVIEGLSSKTYIIKYSDTATQDKIIVNQGIVKVGNYSIISITNNYYNVTIGNQTNPGIWLKGIKIGDKWYNFTSIPHLDWSIVLYNSTVIEPSEFNYTTHILVNGSILSKVLINATWNNTKIKILAEFSNYTPFIDIKYEIYTKDKIKALYIPRYSIPIQFNTLILPSLKTYNTLYVSQLSMYPAYSLIGFSDTKSTIFTGIINNFNGTIDTLLKEFNNTKYNTTKIKFSTILKIKKEKEISELLYNLTYPEIIKSLDINQIFSTLNTLKKNEAIVKRILEQNITKSVLYINDTSILKRILGERWGDTLFLGYQLNLTTSASFPTKFRGFISFTNIPEKNLGYIYENLLNISLILPLQFSISTLAKEEVEVDSVYNLTLSIDVYENISSLNLTLQLPKDAFQNISSNLTVTLWNLTSKEIYNYTWSLIPREVGLYSLNISTQSNRGTINLIVTVNVTSPPLFQPPKELKKYNLTIVVRRINMKPLPGRVVKIFDPSLNETVATGVTDINGSVQFINLTEGIYIVQVQEYNLINNYTLGLFSNKAYHINLNLTDLTIKVTSPSREPIPGVIIRLLDDEGNLVYSSVTDSNGTAVFKSVPLNVYTASLQFSNKIVSNFKINVSKSNNINTTINVYKLRIKAIREKNKPLALAKVEIVQSDNQYGYFAITNMTNLNGECTFYLLKGRYKVRVKRAQYYTEQEVNLENDMNLEIKMNRGNTLWIITLITIVLWASFGFYMYRSQSEIKREENKYIQLLKRLEDYHNRGLIEEKYYVKLKEEYEEKIRKLRGE